MKFNKSKQIILLIICISSFIYLYGCSKENETIKIGVLGTMTGVNSDLSVSGRRGIEIAVDEINKAGGLDGKKFQLVIKDDKNDSQLAVNLVNEFIDEKIPVIIGPYTSGMIVNYMSYLKDRNILFLGPTISSDSLSDIDDNFIRFIATTKEQAIALTDMAKKNNNNKFVVLYDIENKGFNNSLYNNFKKFLEKNGGEIIETKAYTSNSKVDYLWLAKEIAESKAEALFLISNSADGAAITQQLRKISCQIQIYASLWSNTTDLIKKGGAAVEGMFIVGAIDLNDKSSAFVKFEENYIEKYGDEPSFSSVFSYEIAIALLQAMEQGPDLKPSTIKDNIIKIKKFNGLHGEYEVNKFGDNTREYMIFRIENGKLRKVD